MIVVTKLDCFARSVSQASELITQLIDRVDMDTNSVSFVNYTAGIPEEYVKKVKLTSFDGGADEVFDDINKKAEEELAEKYEGYGNFEPIKYVFCDCNDLLVFVKMTAEDGRAVYTDVRISSPVIINDTAIARHLYVQMIYMTP